MFLAKDDDVIETLAPDASDHAFAVRILPGTTSSGKDFLDPESLGCARECAAIDAVAVAQKVSWAMTGFAEGDSLFDLKGGPVRRRRFCDIEVKHSSPIVGQDDEREQDPERRGGDHEEVDRHEIADVIIEERAPGGRRWLANADHVLGNGGLRDLLKSDYVVPSSSAGRGRAVRTLQGSSSVDVYDRRLKIYKAARSFVDLITQNAKVSKQEIGNYSREIEEALFLFDETIEAHLLELFRKAVRLHTIEMVVERADDTKRIQLIDESSNLLIWFNDQTGVIRSKMKPFLSLR